MYSIATRTAAYGLVVEKQGNRQKTIIAEELKNRVVR